MLHSPHLPPQSISTGSRQCGNSYRSVWYNHVVTRPVSLCRPFPSASAVSFACRKFSPCAMFGAVPVCRLFLRRRHIKNAIARSRKKRATVPMPIPTWVPVVSPVLTGAVIVGNELLVVIVRDEAGVEDAKDKDEVGAVVVRSEGCHLISTPKALIAPPAFSAPPPVTVDVSKSFPGVRVV